MQSKLFLSMLLQLIVQINKPIFEDDELMKKNEIENTNRETGVRYLQRENSTYDNMKKESNTFNEIIISAIILGLTINVLSNFIWSVADFLIEPLQWVYKGLMIASIIFVISYYYNHLADVRTREIRDIYGTNEESFFVDTSNGHIPELAFESQLELHTLVHNYAELLLNHDMNNLLELLNNINDMHRWKIQNIGSRIFGIILLDLNLGVKHRPSGVSEASFKIGELIPEDEILVKDRSFIGLNVPRGLNDSPPEVSYQVDEYGNGLLEILWKDVGVTKIVWSSDCRNVQYIANDLVTRINGEDLYKRLSPEIDVDDLIAIKVRWEISGHFEAKSIVSGKSDPYYRWTVDMIEEFW
jgi:hypothetical protein